MLATYFGLPGSGKTTFAVSLIYKFLKSKKNINRFVYTNISTSFISDPRVIKIDPDQFGVFEMMDGILVFDEASQAWDNRDFKRFPKEAVKAFNEYRHHFLDVHLFVQKYDALDSKIRSVCDSVYYIHRSKSIMFWKSTAWKIPKKVLIASEADASKLSGGEICMGYVKPDIISRLFSSRITRRKYFKFFDSFIVDPLPPLPQARDNQLYQESYKLFCERAAARRQHLIDMSPLGSKSKPSA